MHLPQDQHLAPIRINHLQTGNKYTSPSSPEFQHDWNSRFLFTYRKDFRPIRREYCTATGRTGNPLTGSSKSGKGQSINTDKGWGCYIRVFQMMLAQCYSVTIFGRDWRAGMSPAGAGSVEMVGTNPHSTAALLQMQRAQQANAAGQEAVRGAGGPLASPVGAQGGAADPGVLTNLSSNLRNLQTRVNTAVQTRIQSAVTGAIESVVQTTTGGPSLQMQQKQMADMGGGGDPLEREFVKELFVDSEKAVFSVHNFCRIGATFCGRRAGEWFGPNSAAKACRLLFDEVHGGLDLTRSEDEGSGTGEEGAKEAPVPKAVSTSHHHRTSRSRKRYKFAHRIRLCVFEDGALDPELVRLNFRGLGGSSGEAAMIARMQGQFPGPSGPGASSSSSAASPSGSAPNSSSSAAGPGGGNFEVAIFLCKKLGPDVMIAPEYTEAVRQAFKCRSFQGLACGDTATSAHYFIACSDMHLYYLDPHVEVRPALHGAEMDNSSWHSLTRPGGSASAGGNGSSGSWFGFGSGSSGASGQDADATATQQPEDATGAAAPAQAAATGASAGASSDPCLFKLPFEALNSSCCFCFLVRSEDELTQLCLELQMFDALHETFEVLNFGAGPGGGGANPSSPSLLAKDFSNLAMSPSPKASPNLSGVSPSPSPKAAGQSASANKSDGKVGDGGDDAKAEDAGGVTSPQSAGGEGGGYFATLGDGLGVSKWDVDDEDGDMVLL